MDIFLPLMIVGSGALLVVLLAIPALVAVVRVGRRRAADRSAPQRRSDARVVDKRTHLTGGGNTPVEQRYFLTFQLASGERVELSVPGAVSGTLVPGDEGALEWKGSRYLDFDREILR